MFGAIFRRVVRLPVSKASPRRLAPGCHTPEAPTATSPPKCVPVARSPPENPSWLRGYLHICARLVCVRPSRPFDSVNNPHCDHSIAGPSHRVNLSQLVCAAPLGPVFCPSPPPRPRSSWAHSQPSGPLRSAYSARIARPPAISDPFIRHRSSGVVPGEIRFLPDYVPPVRVGTKMMDPPPPPRLSSSPHHYPTAETPARGVRFLASFLSPAPICPPPSCFPELACELFPSVPFHTAFFVASGFPAARSLRPYLFSPGLLASPAPRLAERSGHLAGETSRPVNPIA